MDEELIAWRPLGEAKAILVSLHLADLVLMVFDIICKDN